MVNKNKKIILLLGCLNNKKTSKPSKIKGKGLKNQIQSQWKIGQKSPNSQSP
jgi:hypothetical protein